MPVFKGLGDGVENFRNLIMAWSFQLLPLIHEPTTVTLWEQKTFLSPKKLPEFQKKPYVKNQGQRLSFKTT